MENLNAEHFLGLILGSIPDGIVTVTKDLLISSMNPAAESLAGISSSKCVGKEVEIVFPNDPRIRKILMDSLETTKSFTSHDYSYHGRNRGTYHLSLVAACLIDPKGSVEGLVLILRDMTHLKLLEEGLRKQDRLAMVGTLAVGLAHEIKNPLGGVRGSAQLLAEQLKTPDYTTLLDIIIKEVDRINSLVQELLDLSRPRECVFSPFNIHQSLDDVLRLLERNLAEKSIAVKRDFDPSLPPVRMDPARIRQVFLNLLNNSIESMPKGGELTVGTEFFLNFRMDTPVFPEFTQDMVRVEIKDSGVGLPKGSAEKLFTPFFTTKQSGTGLGLAVSFKIIQDHGGTIQLSNREDGPGCSARVFLPVWEGTRGKGKPQ